MSDEKVRIHFLGAAETVTGSKYLLEAGDKKIMVDCGLFQGIKKLRLLNWEYLPVNVKEVDLVLLTHGHLDHCGYLPRLVQSGFKGQIIGTPPTLDIAQIILEDSGKIQEEEAERANKEGYSKHNPAKPLYDLKDVEKTLGFFKNVQAEEWHQLSENIRYRFRYVGHIIGATFIELEINGKLFVFSGDIGREEDRLMRPPQKPEKADVLFVESTYGDRLHPKENTSAKLAEVVKQTVNDGGTLIIPSFAVERAQSLMYLLYELRKNRQIPEVSMVLDSPMGSRVLDVFRTHSDWHKLSEQECVKMCKQFTIVQDIRETYQLIFDKKPKIVIAGSGMITGGRVLNYLEHLLDKPETTVLLVGYQAEGTRGRHLLEGAPDLKIHGKYLPVKARVETIDGLSAHADQKELLNWMNGIQNQPEKVFIVHGERQAADAMRVKITDTYGWDCVVPELYGIVEV